MYAFIKLSRRWLQQALHATPELLREKLPTQYRALSNFARKALPVVASAVAAVPVLTALPPLGLTSAASEVEEVTSTKPHLAPITPEFALTGLSKVASARSQTFVSPDNAAAWPTNITRAYDPPAQPWLPGHRGVDLELQPGDTVFAAGDGIVHFSGVIAGTPTISITHASGIRTSYQPVESDLSAGDPVSRGMPIGTLGSSAKHPNLHFGAIIGPKEYMNPLDLLQAPEVYLLQLPQKAAA